MDQQKNHAPTEAEIARLEAEAVAAMRRGEQGDSGQPSQAPAQPEFVPYVDDVPEPGPTEAALAREDGEEDGEYIPGPWERRIDALSPGQWRAWQIAGGAAVGLVAVASLFIFGEELSTYGLIVAALLALLLPRYLERAWRRKLTTARYAMAAAMLAGLAVTAAIMLARQRG